MRHQKVWIYPSASPENACRCCWCVLVCRASRGVNKPLCKTTIHYTQPTDLTLARRACVTSRTPDTAFLVPHMKSGIRQYYLHFHCLRTVILKLCSRDASFDVPTAVKIQVEIFWVVTSCSVVVGYQCFGGLRCFHLKSEVNVL
jgi:hypothetical protein